MNKLHRIANTFLGILLLLLVAGILYLGTYGYYIVLFLLMLTLTVNGLQQIAYYLFMARKMVGGWRILFQGVITLDVGLFALSLNNVSVRYVMLYLIAINLFHGLVITLRALEARKVHVRSWYVTMISGGSVIVCSVVGLFLLDSARLAAGLYCLSLIYSGLFRLFLAFHKDPMPIRRY